MSDRAIRFGMIQLNMLHFSSGTWDASVTAYLPRRSMVSIDVGNPCQKFRFEVTVLIKKLRHVKIKGW